MNANDKITMLAQFALSISFIGGYFMVIWLFMAGRADVPVDYKEAFVGFLGVLTGAVITIMQFWFNRSRATSASGTT